MRQLVMSAVLTLVIGLDVCGGHAAHAQELATVSYERGPRFLLATAPTKVIPVDVSRTPVLARRLSLELEGATLKAALAEIASQAGLRLAYSDDVVPLGRRVHLRAEAITAAAALTDVLFDAGVDVVFRPDGSAALVKRPPAIPVPQGAIAGRVTDTKTQNVLVGATVMVLGTNHSATTGSDGRYRIADMAPGTYTVRARYIGYTPASTSVSLGGDQEATADFALERSAQRLDEVVTTGTMLPTAVKALPTPISVISESDLAAQRPHTMAEIFRQVVPTAVTWDFAGYPIQTAFSVRGASGLSGGSGQMKIFVDGVPVASSTAGGIDPNSVERVEVIRGPQAAAIYGSDAVGGVIQVFTKRGDPSLTRPQLDGEAAVGLIQTPYAGYSSVVRQSYRASISGGAPGTGYNLGAGYSHTPDWVHPVSAQSSASVFGGVHFTRGLVTADMSGRYYTQDTPQTMNPALASTGFVYALKPPYQLTRFLAQTVGARLTLAPTGWWHHTVTVGIDRINVDATQTQPRLTTPADTFFTATNQDLTKTSIGYNTSVAGALARATTGSLTVGFDHYGRPENFWYAGQATAANIASGNFDSPFLQRTATSNTGYFAQAQVAFHDALFLTGGIRAEQNSNFGDSLGTPVSPQFGLTFVHSVGAATVKLRGSWGRAIRPPSPGDKAASGGVSSGYINLANPLLAPERQQGGDIGIDAVFGTRGSLSVTYFNQTAEDLITTALLSETPVVTYQNQNVGRVKNIGLEVEGTFAAGPVELKGQYGYVRSRVEDLGSSFDGDLQVGDSPLTTPQHTAGATMTITPFAGTSLAAGLAYVGSWNSYDYMARYRCLSGKDPCRPGPGRRSYIAPYPSFVKLNATISQRITPALSGFVSVDNLTNSTASEFHEAGAVMGRITTVGLQVHP